MKTEREVLKQQVDWTVDPGSGRSNSSKEFLRMVQELDRLILSSAHSLIRGDSKNVARLIMAQLAHKHGYRPPRKKR